MFGLGRTTALAIAASVLGAALLGTVALGAFSPSTGGTSSVVAPQDGATAPANAPAGDRLKAVLDGLVAKGVITRAQEDAILGALDDARTGGGRLLKGLVAKALQRSAAYLDVDVKTLRQQLPGKSLAQIANATAGRSRDGLVAALVADADAAIDRALASGKITPDQADKAKAAAPDRIGQLVDRTWPSRTPGPGPRQKGLPLPPARP